MRISVIAVVVPLLWLPHLASAQGVVPVSVAQAEAEGAAFPRAAADSGAQPFFSRPFAGTSDRRCVASDSEPDPRATLSLRSGEMILRGRWNDPAALAPGDSNKFLWMPLHGSRAMNAPLVLRADRLGEPADSLRVGVAHVARGGGLHTYGYPSLVSFPSAGRWLVVATTGDDWGCFVLDVTPSRAGTR